LYNVEQEIVKFGPRPNISITNQL